ncbi:MAG TPA: YetF domain-containing protein [Nitrososphaeraceae archaeon]|nr:YetF domain-containing protein [Nitrososphaeraceae archaeon]
MNNLSRFSGGNRSINVNQSQTSIPPGFTVVIIAITIFEIYDYLTIKYTKFSKVIEPGPILLVKDGKMIEEAIKKAKISRKELESYLRLTGIDNLSEIKLSYFRN